MKKEEENKTVDEALAKLKKKYGSDVLLQMDKNIDFKVEAIPTGCPQLDDAFGCGGLPRGRLIELFGAESGGKSTMSMFFMAQIQRNGGRAALIDAECSFDGTYASKIGVDVNKLMVSQPATLEEAMDVMKELVETHAFDIIVLDSVAALTPKSELEGEEMLKDTMAVQARLLGKALRILTGPISKSKTVVIFVNQLRDKIGTFYGAKTTTPGGRALKFFSSVRVDVSKGDKIEEDGVQVGNWLRTKMVKNKVGFPWKEAEFELYYGRGLDLVGANLDYATEKGLLNKTGNTYSFLNGDKIAVGRDAVKKFFLQQGEAYEVLLERIKEYKKNGNS